MLSKEEGEVDERPPARIFGGYPDSHGALQLIGPRGKTRLWDISNLRDRATCTARLLWEWAPPISFSSSRRFVVILIVRIMGLGRRVILKDLCCVYSDNLWYQNAWECFSSRASSEFTLSRWNVLRLSMYNARRREIDIEYNQPIRFE